MAPIAIGDTIPDGKLYFTKNMRAFETVSLYSIITGKKVFIIGVSGAFMPDTRWLHSPIHSVQEALFICVNDPYVVRGWELGYFRNKTHVKFLADPTAAYVTSLGLEIDLTSGGFGVRSRRFGMVLEDQKVVELRIGKIPRVWSPPLSFFERPTPIRSGAPIAVGNIVPDGMLTFFNQQKQIEPVSMYSIVSGKKVLVLGVRGAFFPVCRYFVRTFIVKADDFKSMGVQEILCISVNDPYAMRAWKRAYFRDNTEINFLADSTAAYVTSLGLVDDLSHTVFGIRSNWFALLLEDCRVKVLEVHTKGNDMRDMHVAGDMLVAMAGAELRDMEM